MSALSLSQLLAVLQDNLQRSYEHAETLAVLDRGGDVEKITMALDRVEVEVPIFAQFTESKQDMTKAFAALEGLTAYELASARVDLPTATPVLRRAVQDQIKLVSAGTAVQMELETQVAADKQDAKVVSKKIALMDADIAAARTDAVDELSEVSSVVRNVLFDTSAAAFEGAAAGKLTVQFKAVLQ